VLLRSSSVCSLVSSSKASGKKKSLLSLRFFINRNETAVRAQRAQAGRQRAGAYKLGGLALVLAKALGNAAALPSFPLEGELGLGVPGQW